MSTVKEPLHPLRTARYLWLGILLCALVGGVAGTAFGFLAARRRK